MIERRIGDRVLRLTVADITTVEAEAFVYDARPDLVLGAGFGGAIAVRGGPGIQQELKGLAPVPVGGAVVSGAGKLKARHIIHAVTPKFQEADEEAKLRAAVASALARADELGIARLAMPALGAGFYGMPADRCAAILLDVARAHLAAGRTSVLELTICLLDSRQLAAFEAALASVPS